MPEMLTYHCRVCGERMRSTQWVERCFVKLKGKPVCNGPVDPLVFLKVRRVRHNLHSIFDEEPPK